ncbi:MAG TPA: site-specific DNA-methyltransferase [Solirubrobacteraceae bacterium]|nr:site-specific DNA-methyltransferase [Solirubrobacteraceae bacterium]
MAVRLEWEGKPTELERLSLPFQTVETINESRATREREAGALFGAEDGVGKSYPRDLLVWGDNKLVMSSLLSEYAGQIKLIYADPPFATGDDFSVRVQLGDASVVKEPSILEEHAYRDTWGGGLSSYLGMMYERLVLMHELLRQDGALYLHCGTNVSHYLKLLCDEVFGAENFRNEIVWKRKAGRGETTAAAIRFGITTESILFYARSRNTPFKRQYAASNEAYLSSKFNQVDADGRRYHLDNISSPSYRPNLVYDYKGHAPPPKGWAVSRERMEQMEAEGRLYIPADPQRRIRRKRYLDELEGETVDSLWTDVPPINSQAAERTGYETQKPLALLKRIIETSSNPGDLVGDFFCGSGTTLVAAEQLGRHWIGCDLGRFAIHTTRKRLLDVADCHPFEIRNLGAYERQRWQLTSGNGVLRAYLDTILAFYRAEAVEGFEHLHGRKAGRMVHVGATDAPVTIDETEDVMDEMADNGIEACDLLGWEWEMGLHDTITERGRRRGLDVRPRQIPREVMERRVTDTEAVRFFELAYVDLDVRRQGREACVVLKDFAIPSEELIPPNVRERVQSWSDLIDYWSVDYDFKDDVFHNQWQAYRTRGTPALATESGWHEYSGSGRYSIVVKIIDIFGNDTTKLAEVTIK